MVHQRRGPVKVNPTNVYQYKSSFTIDCGITFFSLCDRLPHSFAEKI